MKRFCLVILSTLGLLVGCGAASMRPYVPPVGPDVAPLRVTNASEYEMLLMTFDDGSSCKGRRVLSYNDGLVDFLAPGDSIDTFIRDGEEFALSFGLAVSQEWISGNQIQGGTRETVSCGYTLSFPVKTGLEYTATISNNKESRTCRMEVRENGDQDSQLVQFRKRITKSPWDESGSFCR